VFPITSRCACSSLKKEKYCNIHLVWIAVLIDRNRRESGSLLLHQWDSTWTYFELKIKKKRDADRLIRHPSFCDLRQNRRDSNHQSCLALIPLEKLFPGRNDILVYKHPTYQLTNQPDLRPLYLCFAGLARDLPTTRFPGNRSGIGNQKHKMMNANIIVKAISSEGNLLWLTYTTRTKITT
jgi:hypothetical protein